MDQEIDNSVIDRHIKFYNVVIGLSSTLAIILIYGFGSTFLNYYFTGWHTTKINPLAIALSQILLILIPALLMVYFLKGSFRDYFPLKLPSIKILLLLFVGLIAVLAASEAYLQIQEFLVPHSFKKAYLELQQSYDKMIYQIVGKGNLLILLQALSIIAVIPAIAEEFLFRGYLMRTLGKGLNPMTAIILTAILFSISHLNLINFIPLLFIGFYLGYSSYISSSILVPVLLHFINNAMSVVALYFNGEEISQAQTITNSQINVSIMIFTISVSALIAIIFYLNKLFDKSEPQDINN